MGGFSIPGLSISDVIGGAVKRADEHRENDRKLERERRREHIQNLAKLYEASNQSWQRSWIAEEMARTDEADPEKPFKPRPLPMTPPTPKGQGAGAGTTGADSASQQSPTGAQPRVGLRDLLPQITGEMSGETSGQNGAPASSGGAGEASSQRPDSAAWAPTLGPPGAAQWLPPSAAMLTGSGPGSPNSLSAPAGAPKAVTPPNRSVPEASPIAGSLPGQPSPAAALTPDAGFTPRPSSAVPLTPDLPFLSERDARNQAARDQFALEQEFGRTRSGKMLVPMPTPSDIQNAAGKGYKYTRDGETGQWQIEKMTPEELSLVQKGRLDLATHRSKIDDLRLDLDRQKLDLARSREGRLATQPAKGSLIDPKTRLQAEVRVGSQYRTSVAFYQQADRTLAQIERLATQATGPADYGLILDFVHSIDNTAAREGEVATARSAASVAARMEQYLQKLQTGELLNDDVRAQFVEAARGLNTAIQAQRDAIDEQYGSIADEYGLSRKNIGLGTRTTPGRPAASSSSPKAETQPRLSRVERSKKTGATRTTYSDDGGKTWHP